MEKKLWGELTPEQKTEFIKQLKHVGDRNESNYPKHLYQIKNGVCYGWIAFGKNLKK